jgi:FAD/FMN-containing dehydrogenase
MVTRGKEARLETVIDDLAAIVGVRHVLTGDDLRARWDGYPPLHVTEALCVVRPADTNEVAAIAAYCNGHDLTLVPQGGRTGLAGGARTEPGDIALSLERMTGVGAIDPYGMTMEVEAGVPLQVVQEVATAAGLHYPIDLGARGSATIGGTIATNAGGNSVFRYGMTRDQILGLEIVLADGTILSSMNRLIKNNAAYDLKHLFIGSEGTLGVVTRAILRLRPGEGDKATAFIGLPGFQSVLDLLKLASVASDGALTSFEVMWPSFLDAVGAGGHRPPLAEPHAFYVLFEIVSRKAGELLEQVVGLGWERGLIGDATIAQNVAQARAFWAIRDDIDALIATLKPVFLYDISLPQVHMARYVEDLDAALRRSWPAVRLAVFGHIADGNLHLSISTGEAHDHETVDAIVYAPLETIGGSISAEHGIGLEKRAHLRRSRTLEELALMAKLKAVLDPRSTLNPGKVLPPA